jgi:hypothetical protein
VVLPHLAKAVLFIWLLGALYTSRAMDFRSQVVVPGPLADLLPYLEGARMPMKEVLSL